MSTQQSYVFARAVSLSRRMRIEPDKKRAAHLLCTRLLHAINLKRGHG